MRAVRRAGALRMAPPGGSARIGAAPAWPLHCHAAALRRHQGIGWAEQPRRRGARRGLGPARPDGYRQGCGEHLVRGGPGRLGSARKLGLRICRRSELVHGGEVGPGVTKVEVLEVGVLRVEARNRGCTRSAAISSPAEPAAHGHRGVGEQSIAVVQDREVGECRRRRDPEGGQQRPPAGPPAGRELAGDQQHEDRSDVLIPRGIGRAPEPGVGGSDEPEAEPGHQRDEDPSAQRGAPAQHPSGREGDEGHQ